MNTDYYLINTDNYLINDSTQTITSSTQSITSSLPHQHRLLPHQYRQLSHQRFNTDHYLINTITSSILWLVLALVSRKGMPWVSARSLPRLVGMALLVSQSHLLPINSRSTSADACCGERVNGLKQGTQN